MWPTEAARILHLDVPVVQAPMGGGPSTVGLAAAVSNAGGLGSLAGGYLAPERLRAEIRRLRAATAGPFAVNLFVPTLLQVTSDEVTAAVRLLEPLRAELGLAPCPELTAWSEDFDAQLAVIVEEQVPIFSFAFGTLSPPDMDQLQDAGIVTIGTATNVQEARALVDSGVDIVCAQGAEAGGHHGSWLAPADESLIGTVALVPQVCDAVDVPVIAAGGITDGRGVAAVLCLGAGAAQMGTAFMLTPEAGTSAPHREAIGRAAATDIAVTSTVTGRLARGVRNRLMAELRDSTVPPYPAMNALTSELRRTASAQSRADLMSLWCGQGVPVPGDLSATDIIHSIVESLADIAAELDRAAQTLPR
ncbi:MAG: nitronate monooxygenase [Acidimicrobiia bacterium]|jgi:nitronate monooxygenase|nr:nitronate monooxygenase [Acidimicrobiia bacterium]